MTANFSDALYELSRAQGMSEAASRAARDAANDLITDLHETGFTRPPANPALANQISLLETALDKANALLQQLAARRAYGTMGDRIIANYQTGLAEYNAANARSSGANDTTMRETPITPAESGDVELRETSGIIDYSEETEKLLKQQRSEYTGPNY